MNPRPPYRWKSMWIGLFVLGFLLWAWQDGLHQEIRLTYAGPGNTWQASRLDGSTVLVAGGPMLIESSPGSGWVPGWSFHRAQRRWNLTSATSYWDASSQADVRYLVIPDILVTALKKNKAAQATFENFPSSCKKEYVEWITEAKTEPTREKRLATTMEWLAEGKKRNWKYEKC